MNKYFYSILILFLVIFLVIIFIAFFAKLTNNNNDILAYKVLMPLRGNAPPDMNYCLNGCVRGRCNINSNDPNSCKYDFQCEYCQDRNTNMFYVDYNKEREILPLYDEQKTLNRAQDRLLNKEIEENNEYIKTLNKQIKEDNKDYLEYKTQI